MLGSRGVCSVDCLSGISAISDWATPHVDMDNSPSEVGSIIGPVPPSHCHSTDTRVNDTDDPVSNRRGASMLKPLHEHQQRGDVAMHKLIYPSLSPF